MEGSLKNKQRKRTKRAQRVRQKLRGTAECPRLSVFKSNAHIYAQLIDDDKGVTLGACGTMSKTMRDASLGRRSKAAASELGSKIAEVAKQHSISRVVFDRGSAKYHGVLAALADAAREGGLKF